MTNDRLAHVSSLHEAGLIIHRDVDVESFWSHVFLSSRRMRGERRDMSIAGAPHSSKLIPVASDYSIH